MTNNPISIDKIRAVYNHHGRHHKLKYTFPQFVDFCKTFKINDSDSVEVCVPHSSEAKLCDLRVRRRNERGEEYDVLYWEDLRYEIGEIDDDEEE